MKKLWQKEVVENRVIIIVDKKGNQKFVIARKRHDLEPDGTSRWQVFDGHDVVFVSPYRLDCRHFIEERGWKFENWY
jgi:hypothetical protein